MQVVNLSRLRSLTCSLADDHVHVIVGEAGRVRSVQLGYARLFYINYVERKRSWRVDYEFLGPVQTIQAPEENVAFDLPAAPSMGFVTGRTGLLIAPSAKLDIARGADVWLMFFTPTKGKALINVSKNMLTVSDQDIMAYASMQYVDGRFEGSLSLQGSGNTLAKLVLERRFEKFWEKFVALGEINHVEEIGRATAGEVKHFQWLPAPGPPQPVLIATNSGPWRGQVKKILRSLGCLPANFLETVFLSKVVKRDRVIGDGEYLQYRLKLVLSRRLQRDLADITDVSIGWTPEA